MQDFDTAVGVFAGLLILGALVSGLARRSMLSLAALFVLAGFALGQGQLGVLHFTATSGFVHDLTTIALIVILFRDGLEVEGELLQSAWHLPARKLVIAMPLTGAIVALTARGLIGLPWLQCLLLGALLCPTDPVLSSSVVTNPRVPRIVRHSLNLESGLNDGLALVLVLAFATALKGGDFVWWQFVLENVGFGLVIGVACGFVASWLLPRGGGLMEGIPTHQRALYALGVAFGTYALAVAAPKGNGFIAVFVGAIVLGNRRHDIRAVFAGRSAELVEIVKLGVFVVFGSLLTLDGLFADGWAAVGVVVVTLVVARTVSVWIALAGTGVDTATKAFMAWFGPKGVATMAFSLLVLGQAVPGATEIFNLAALVVVTSIIVHGLSDTPGADWIASRTERAAEQPGGDPVAAAGAISP
jgi:sodium/hydrogen antiporter